MSWFRLSIFCLMLGLAACGFEPLYAAKHPGTALRPAIETLNIPDRDGQYLRNQMIDRLGRPEAALYQLKISPLTKNILNLGIRKDATATRAQIQISAQMQLVEKASGKVLLQRDLRAVSAYNLLDNQLATLTSQQNVTEGMLQELGDDALTEVDLYFRRVQK